MISVMVPARGRTRLLRSMLSTLYATVSNPENVEVIARIDDDDEGMIHYLQLLPQVKVVCKPRVGYAKNAQMVNECAALATGDLFLVANDDLEFKTLDWDLELTKVAAQYPDGIFDLGVDTVLNNENFCFPCTSRKTVEALGFFFDERLLYPDIWMRDVMMPFERAIRVPQVVIQHNWTGMTEDQRRAMTAMHGHGHSELYTQCVEEGREKIRCVLSELRLV